MSTSTHTHSPFEGTHGNSPSSESSLSSLDSWEFNELAKEFSSPKTLPPTPVMESGPAASLSSIASSKYNMETAIQNTVAYRLTLTFFTSLPCLRNRIQWALQMEIDNEIITKPYSRWFQTCQARVPLMTNLNQELADLFNHIVQQIPGEINYMVHYHGRNPLEFDSATIAIQVFRKLAAYRIFPEPHWGDFVDFWERLKTSDIYIIEFALDEWCKDKRCGNSFERGPAHPLYTTPHSLEGRTIFTPK